MLRRVLVVDDDSTVRDMLACFLGAAYEIESAATAAAALLKLRHAPVDLLVLDHRLPDRTGLDFLADLRALRPRLPVVMLTGYGSEWICARAFRLGVTDYLQKPVGSAELVETVQHILSPTAGNPADPVESDRPGDAPPRDRPPIQRAVALIQEHYWEPISLASLARRVGMSKYHLSHRFREVLGITFRDYLLKVRLERAKALLASPDVSITDVAQRVGFGDLPRFDKVFKRHMGCSPSAYRSLAPLDATSDKHGATNY
jgi:two-component system response regulator YesN